MEKNLLIMLERRGIITTDPKQANECCGLERDDDGFCQHRLYHPIYVPAPRCSDCGARIVDHEWLCD